MLFVHNNDTREFSREMFQCSAYIYFDFINALQKYYRLIAMK